MNDLSLHILDIMQNSVAAEATFISLFICIDWENDILIVSVTDNGKGMTTEELDRVSDPFFTSRTTRRVGLGIPLFRQSAVHSGGDLVVTSEKGEGTIVKATFRYSSIDRPPIGDIANTFVLMVSSNSNVHFLLEYRKNGKSYMLNSLELKDALGGVPISNPSIIKAITEMIDENFKAL